MKTLNSLATKYGTRDNTTGTVYVPFNNGDLVVATSSEGRVVRHSPRPHEDIVCPRCGSTFGQKIRNRSELWWACAEYDCMIANTKTGRERLPPPRRERFDPSAYQVPELYADSSFDKYEFPEESVRIMKDWVRRPKGFFILIGGNGTGKTTASVAMLRLWAESGGVSAHFVDAPTLRYQWMEETRSDGLKRLPDVLMNRDLLVLDDLGQQRTTEAFYEFLFLIINRRMNTCKPTIITTNLEIEEMHDKLSDSLASRLLAGQNKILALDGYDRR